MEQFPPYKQLDFEQPDFPSPDENASLFFSTTPSLNNSSNSPSQPVDTALSPAQDALSLLETHKTPLISSSKSGSSRDTTPTIQADTLNNTLPTSPIPHAGTGTGREPLLPSPLPGTPDSARISQLPGQDLLKITLVKIETFKLPGFARLSHIADIVTARHPAPPVAPPAAQNSLNDSCGQA